MTTSRRVLLVRCGGTEWDEAGRLAGATDLPLSPAGRDAVQEQLEQLGEVRLSTVLCGPTEACEATARMLAERTGAKVRVVKGLGEVHLGLWEGLREADLCERYPRAYRQWMTDPGSVVPPEGEPLEAAQRRIVGALARALEKSRNSAVAVVLGPMALALLRRCLVGRGTRDLWAYGDSQPPLEWVTLSSDALKELESGAETRA